MSVFTLHVVVAQPQLMMRYFPFPFILRISYFVIPEVLC